MRIETKGEIQRRLFKDKSNSSLARDINRMDDLDIVDSTKLESLIEEAEARSPRLSLFNEFLKCNVLSQVINSKTFPKYKCGIISVASDNIIKEKFEIVEKMWFGYSDNLMPAKMEEIKVDVDKSHKALVQGYYFLKHKDSGKNFIFGIDFIDGYMTGYVAFYSNEKNSNIASSIMKDILNWAITNNFLKGKKINSHGKFIKVDKITMDDVILKDEIKTRIISGTIDMFNNVEQYKKNNISIKRGILMEGEPGTGKTLVAKALCNQIDSTFIWITADDITYPSDVSAIYNMARELAPTIILFEDIDYIGKDRADYRGSFDKITGELLNQLDGLESNEGIITLASSNYPKALDKALRNRPGRFDIRIRFDLPDGDLRMKMLTKFFGEADIADIDLEEVVDITDGYTGAYVKELVVATIMLAVTDKSIQDNGNAIIKEKHINEAFNELENSRKLDEEE